MKSRHEPQFLSGDCHAPLSVEIQKEFNKLTKLVAAVPKTERGKRNLDGTGGKVSVSDLIAYQIGWGKLLVGWYQAGLNGRTPEMPGEGFTTWDYVGLAQHFYHKWQLDGAATQDGAFFAIATEIVAIVEVTHASNQLDMPGIWSWCTLPSGREWTLGKWVKVNTASPYKRAASLVRAGLSSVGKDA